MDYGTSTETSTGRIETPELVGVKVAYTVERTVYVYAYSNHEARVNAKDSSNWADADEPVPNMDTVRVPRTPKDSR